MLTEDNLSHWITSKAQDEQIRIKNHEKTGIQQNEYDACFSAIDQRDYPKHNNLSKTHRNRLDMEGFYNWYNEQVKGIHPITNEVFDRISAEHFN